MRNKRLHDDFGACKFTKNTYKFIAVADIAVPFVGVL